MEVRFRRSGERRYTVTVLRDGLPPHEFGGPGYDPKMPHDLLHFIVERELGLRQGIFGFLAAGGETRGDEHEAGRAASRQRRKGKRRDQRMLRQGERAEAAASEHATYACWCEWLRRSGDPRARDLAENVASTPDRMAKEARQQYGEEALARIFASMDELSARWSHLAIGESFSVPWDVASSARGTSRRLARRRGRCASAARGVHARTS
jgi:hypothetical protein